MKIKFILTILVATVFIGSVSATAYLHQVTSTKNIIVNGVDVLTQTLDSFNILVDNYLATPIQFSVDDHVQEFSLGDLGYTIDKSAVEDYFNQLTGFQRILHYIVRSNPPIDVSMTYDVSVMLDTLSAWLDTIDPVKDAKNAEIVFDKETMNYSISSHSDGSMDRRAVLRYMSSQVISGNDNVSLDSSTYRNLAVVTSQDENLTTYVNTWNQILQTNIIDMGGGGSYELPPSAFHSWLELDSDTLEFTIDDESINVFVSELAKTFNTIGNSIEFTSTNDGTITVPGGDYGWWLNTGETSKVLRNLLTDPEVFEVNALWRQEGANRNGSSIGESYVEINLSKQHLWLYSDGELKHDTPIVTGKTSSPTRRGVFGITYTQRNGRLRGPTWDVTVAYWMPFDGDIGMHDATWQSRFGGERYRQGYGSNGCVNLPLKSAEIIFQYVRTGFPVVVY